MKPIEVTIPFMGPGRGLTLWPFCFYGPGGKDDKCLQVHEHYHWDQALRWGVIPWYVVYGLLALRWGTSTEHPLERPAYAAQAACEAQKP